MARVIVPAFNTRYDYAPASEYGELTFLMKDRGIVSPFKTDQLVDALRDQLREISYDPAVDWLAMTGGLIQIGITMCLASKMSGSLRVLLFDATSSKYVPRTLEL